MRGPASLTTIAFLADVHGAYGMASITIRGLDDDLKQRVGETAPVVSRPLAADPGALYRRRMRAGARDDGDGLA